MRVPGRRQEIRRPVGMKTIGILGGLGPESTIAYYSIITRGYYELRKDYAYPEIIIHSFNFAEFIEAEYELPARVMNAINGLHHAGADFVVAACNSVHVVHDEIGLDTPIPWISIMDATAEQIDKLGLSKVGLLGTIFTMGNDFYQKTLAEYGIETFVPDAEAQQRINEIIYGELVRAEVKEESRREVLAMMEELKQQGAEGIVLGCTELPFLIREEDTDCQLFDTTKIHARKALELALW